VREVWRLELVGMHCGGERGVKVECDEAKSKAKKTLFSCERE